MNQRMSNLKGIKRILSQRFPSTRLRYIQVRTRIINFRYYCRYLIWKEDIFIVFDYKRRLTKAFVEIFEKKDDLIRIGNYELHPRLNQKMQPLIVYSCGVGTNILFDEEFEKSYANCSIFLFDPTPNAIKFIKTKKLSDKILFEPVAIVGKDSSNLKLYEPLIGNTNYSMMYDAEITTESFIEVPAKTISQIMLEHNHKSVDVLKLDIEGASIGVLQSIIRDEIYPDQICVELERPNYVMDLIKYFMDILTIKEIFENKGYQIYYLPRNKFSFYSIELLFVKDKF